MAKRVLREMYSPNDSLTITGKEFATYFLSVFNPVAMYQVIIGIDEYRYQLFGRNFSKEKFCKLLVGEQY